MKKIISLILAVITVVSAASLASCGTPTESTAPDLSDTSTPETNAPETSAPESSAPETNAPETNAPETNAPESSDEPFVQPDDPTFDPEEEEKADVAFEYDFSTVASIGELDNNEFSLTKKDGWTLVDGYIVNGAPNSQLAISDNQLALPNKSFMTEIEVCFDVLPHKADGVTNFPLSIISWIRTSSSQTFYDWIVKLDDEGYLYVKDLDTKTDAKIEAGKKHTIGVFIDDINSTAKVYLDGRVVGVRNIGHRDAIASTVRFFDDGKEKAHFTAKVYAARAYYMDEAESLGDAQRDVFTAREQSPGSAICFVGYTDKDALSYAVGEEMKFEIFLTCNGEVVSAPYFYYSVAGEDGQKKTEGYADGSKGHFTVTAKMSKPGAVRVEAYVCDENKVKQTKNNSNLYVDLETSTPQKSNLCFKGGAIAGFADIAAGGKIPADLADYWEDVVADCYNGDIKLLRFEELDPASHGGTASKHHLYLVEIECAGGFATGYLTVPKGVTKLNVSAKFVSYGNKKKPTPSFSGTDAVFSICAHSYHLDDPNAAAPDSYGFNNTENQNRDTVYFKNMFIRNITATRFLKAYIGDASYGRIVLDGKTVAPLNLWKKGDKYGVSGGSQASFQSVAIAALDKDVTVASFGVPWFCDIGGDLVGRFDGWNPDYTDALMYYDSVALATLIESDVEVTITAGLGDTTSEPSGVVALYNALDCPKTMTMYQNREHTYNPPISVKYKVSE